MGIVLAVVVLGLLGVSGSSIGVYATENGGSEHSAGVLVGPPRPIRSDEWLVRTPWVLRQLERGMPKQVAGALGSHDSGVLSDVPTGGWEVILRPHTAGYRFLDAERAVAIEWWALFAVQLLGVYALLQTLTGRVALSALAASLVTLSPATQWWTFPPTFTAIGYGSLAMALVLRAYRARKGHHRIMLSVVAGFALAAFLAGLYPPWQIGTALVLIPIGVATVFPDLWAGVSRRRALRSLAVTLALAMGVGGGLFVSFIAGHRQAIDSISATVYPGQRSASVGGGTDMRRVLSSAFDYFSSDKQFSLVNETNQSENSSALPLLLPVSAACLMLLVRRRLKGSRAAPALLGCLVGGAVLASWMFLRVPADVGRFLLLTRIPPPRLLLPLGFAGTIALALLASHQHEPGTHLTRWQILPSVGLCGLALAWGANRYSMEGVHIDMRVAGVFMLVVLVGLAFSLGRRPEAGLAILVLFSAWQASRINPIQDGLGPLVESPLRHTIDSLKQGAPPDAGWIAFSVDATVKGTLTAAGVNNLSGVSPYPDYTAWRILDPDLKSEEIWNRYAHLSFIPGAPGVAPSFLLRAGDDVAVTLDPCSAAVRDLGATFAVTQGFEIGSCVRPLVKVPYGKSYVMLYKY